jgi:hypothetical protein
MTSAAQTTVRRYTVTGMTCDVEAAGYEVAS